DERRLAGRIAARLPVQPLPIPHIEHAALVRFDLRVPAHTAASAVRGPNASMGCQAGRLVWPMLARVRGYAAWRLTRPALARRASALLAAACRGWVPRVPQSQWTKEAAANRWTEPMAATPRSTSQARSLC